MNCQDLQHQLANGIHSGPEVDVHLATCAPCTELVADGGALASVLADAAAVPAELGDMSAALFQAIEEDGGPLGALRRIPPWVRGAVLIALAAAIGIGEWITGLRPDFEAYPTQMMVLALLALGGPVIGLSIAGTRPLYRPPLPSGMFYGMLTTAVSIPLILGSMPAPHDHPASNITGIFIPATIACFGFGTLIASLVLIVHKLMDRRIHADRNVTALVALVGTVAGTIALQIHCPFTDNAHLLIGHAGPGVVFTVAIFAIFNARRGR